jgi:hypothetical protein
MDVKNVKPNRAQRKKFKKMTGVDPDKLNAAGFYDGMPGVYLDSEGNQRIYEIVLTPDNTLITRMGVLPQGIAKAFRALMDDNPMSRNAMCLAVDKYRATQKKYQRRARWKARLAKFLKMFRKNKLSETEQGMKSDSGTRVPANMKVVGKKQAEKNSKPQKEAANEKKS